MTTPTVERSDPQTLTLRAELLFAQRNLAALLTVARTSRGVTDPYLVMDAIYDQLVAILPVDAFSVVVCTDEQAADYRYMLMVDEGVHYQIDDTARGGLTGYILSRQEPLFFTDLHDQYPSELPRPLPFGNTTKRSRAWLGVPLLAGRMVLGAMTVQSYQPNAYTQADLELVVAMADLAAVSIENAVLYQQQAQLTHSLTERVTARQEELAVLSALAAGLSRGESTPALLNEALERVLWLFGLDAGAVWLSDRPKSLRRAAWRANGDAPHAAEYLSVDGDSVEAEALRSGGLLQAPVQDCLACAVPLRAHGRNVGVMTLWGGRRLDDPEVALLGAAADQIALGIENGRLLRERDRQIRQLEALGSIAGMLSSSLDPAEVLRIAAEQLTQLFAVDHVAVTLFNDDISFGRIAAEYPILGAVGLRLPLHQVNISEVAPASGQPVFVTNIADDPRVRPVRGILLAQGIEAMVVVPLISRGHVLGVVSLNLRRRDRIFTEEDFELCRTIAAQVSTALENARLHQITVTRVEQELEIARSIQSNLFPRVLPQIPGVSLAARCMPAKETGGDFYDVLPLGNDRFGFSIGDVSGKSLPAAMLMAVARSIVRSEALDHYEPNVVMAETNGLVAQDVPPNAFVALCYAVYDAQTRELVVASAGQMTPLVRHADGQVAWLPVEPNLPLGIVPDLLYKASSVQLQPGDTVLFFTDGLVEAFTPQREMFGFERLKALFATCGHRPAAEVVDLLLEEVCSWQGDENRHDDMTAIVAHLA